MCISVLEATGIASAGISCSMGLIMASCQKNGRWFEGYLLLLLLRLWAGQAHVARGELLAQASRPLTLLMSKFSRFLSDDDRHGTEIIGFPFPPPMRTT